MGELIRTLKDLDMIDETLVILNADHGESLGEHRIYFDHHGLYEPTIRVPLILSLPKTLPGNRRIRALCQHADLLPTILDLTGIRPPQGVGFLDGRSLMPLIREKVKEIHPFVISCEANWQLKRSIRTHQWKLIQSLEKDAYGNPRFELYDLKSDPGETKNLASRHPDIVRGLHQRMNRWIRKMLVKYKRKDPLRGGVKVRLHRMTVAEEEKVKKRLSELGY